MRIGVFGGTFNPIHQGHLSLIDAMHQQLSLDKVILVPSSIPPHKDDSQVVSFFHRARMCALAIADRPFAEVCTIEQDREGKSYTVDTLSSLSVIYPKDELVLLMGSDMFYSVLQWNRAEKLIKLCEIAVVAREEDEHDKLIDHSIELNGKGARTRVVKVDPTVVSSTQIRESIEQSEKLPELVSRYISQNALYGAKQDLMIDLDELTAKIRSMLSPVRYNHTLNVASEALRLAEIHGADKECAYLAGLLHDVCKEFSQEEMLKILKDSDIINFVDFRSSPKLWHGYAGAIYIQDELNVYNAQIIDAVRYHTVGRGGMSLLEEIVYLADLVSADRDYPDLPTMREKAYNNVNKAMLYAVRFSMDEQIRKKNYIMCDTLNAYNSYITKNK